MLIDNYKDTLFKSLTAWFTELAALAEKTEDSSSLPKLELFLRSGHVIRGSIVKVSGHAHEQLLMVMGLLDPYTKAEITIVSSHEVVALTLLEPENYLKHFAAPAGHKIIGVLELKRAAKNVEAELEKAVQEIISLNLDIDTYAENARWDVLRTIGFLPSIFGDVASDDLGKKQIKANIRNISIKVSDSNKTTLLDRTLQLQITAPLMTPISKEKERIKAEIEGVL